MNKLIYLSKADIITLFCPTGFKGYLYIYTISKEINTTFFLSIPYPTPSLSFPPFSIPLSSILSLFRLRSVFLPVPYPPSLSVRRIRSTCARSSLSPHGTSCTFFILFPSNTCSLSPRSHI
jgi:hypothetical protein